MIREKNFGKILKKNYKTHTEKRKLSIVMMGIIIIIIITMIIGFGL